MEALLPFLAIIAVGIVLMIGAVVIKGVPGNSPQKDSNFPYQRQGELFTKAERSFLGVLEQAVEGHAKVFGKVRIADVIKPLSGLDPSARSKAFNRIQSKHFDFLL